MAEVTNKNDGAELRINDDVCDVAAMEAERIFDSTEYNVTVNTPRGITEKAEIVVYWDNDMDRVNGYHKATVINEVLQSPASVEVNCTEEGSDAVSFNAR